MMDMLWLLPLGFIAGTIGSMVGLGGGIITVPVMTLAGYSPTLAVTVSLYAIFSNAAAPTSRDSIIRKFFCFTLDESFDPNSPPANAPTESIAS